MENMQDFVIEDGVLTKYNGPGGDVTLPENVIKIGNWAFSGCVNLTDITLLKGIEAIGEWAFVDCTSLTSVILPEGVTEIGRYAFRSCTNLQSITIPASVTTELDNSMFWGCSGLQNVTLLGNMHITKTVFRDSRPALLAPHIPVADFDQADRPGAVCGFVRLYEDGAELDEEIKVGNLKYIKSQRKRLFPLAVQHEELLRLMMKEKMLVRADIDPLLAECDKQNNISAKAAVLDYAGRNLKPVDPVKEMEKKFAAMDRADTAKDRSDAARDRAEKAFSESGIMSVALAKERYTYGPTKSGEGLKINSWRGKETDVVVPKMIGKKLVTEIDKRAFKNCKGLASVVIPAGVTEIGTSAFEGCKKLTSVTIPESVTEIGVCTFYYCTGLTSATIPENVTEIHPSAFYGCKNLTIHAPAGSYAEEYAKKNKIKFEPV